MASGSDAHRSRSQARAVLAASPASLQPSNASTRTGSSSWGRSPVQRTCSIKQPRVPASRRSGPVPRLVVVLGADRPHVVEPVALVDIGRALHEIAGLARLGGLERP